MSGVAGDADCLTGIVYNQSHTLLPEKNVHAWIANQDVVSLQVKIKDLKIKHHEFKINTLATLNDMAMIFKTAQVELIDRSNKHHFDKNPPLVVCDKDMQIRTLNSMIRRQQPFPFVGSHSLFFYTGDRKSSEHSRGGL